MFIRKLEPDQLHPAYNILFHVFYPWEDVVTPPFGVGRGVVEPGGHTLRHNHHEAETFIITRGAGELAVDDRRERVEPGHVIYFNRELQDRALGLFREALTLRGFLGLGSKESLRFSAHAQAFEEIVPHQRVFQKRGSA